MNTNLKKIMIQEHPTKGKEIIKALENLGGINYFNLVGNTKEYYYYINDIDYIYIGDMLMLYQIKNMIY